ncbi:MAG: hypothetical protein J5U19_09950 [Candidatus Methanoperedens sp.]|nr:hypothetical protein [Candidatus Methanoperedens sp.]
MVEETKLEEEKLVWKEEELKLQIRSLENQIFITQKQGGELSKISSALCDLKSAVEEFAAKNFTKTEKHLIDIKKGLNEIIHELPPWRKITYFVSVWGLIPIATAISAGIISFYFLNSMSNATIGLGVPLWASLVAVIGASVQILVGIINDYREDSMISHYKKLWYLVLPFVSFVFGFIAILLIQAGLINITIGQPSLNQTMNISELTNLAKGETSIYPSSFSIITCFLAGYATDWFMGLLGKLVPSKVTEK